MDRIVPTEVVRTDQAEAVFDEIPVAAFAVAERIVHMPPGSRHAFERGGVTRCGEFSRAVRLFARISR